MENRYIPIEELKKLYPDEWILLGNPQIRSTSVLGGVVLFHSRDKKEVCYIGKDKTSDYETVTITFAGDLKHHRKIGILRKL
jgi:hypothetical protein